MASRGRALLSEVERLNERTKRVNLIPRIESSSNGVGYECAVNPILAANLPQVAIVGTELQISMFQFTLTVPPLNTVAGYSKPSQNGYINAVKGVSDKAPVLVRPQSVISSLDHIRLPLNLKKLATYQKMVLSDANYHGFGTAYLLSELTEKERSRTATAAFCDRLCHYVPECDQPVFDESIDHVGKWKRCECETRCSDSALYQLMCMLRVPDFKFDFGSVENAYSGEYNNRGLNYYIDASLKRLLLAVENNCFKLLIHCAKNSCEDMYELLHATVGHRDDDIQVASVGFCKYTTKEDIVYGQKMFLRKDSRFMRNGKWVNNIPQFPRMVGPIEPSKYATYFQEYPYLCKLVAFSLLCKTMLPFFSEYLFITQDVESDAQLLCDKLALTGKNGWNAAMCYRIAMFSLLRLVDAQRSFIVTLNGSPKRMENVKNVFLFKTTKPVDEKFADRFKDFDVIKESDYMFNKINIPLLFGLLDKTQQSFLNFNALMNEIKSKNKPVLVIGFESEKFVYYDAVTDKEGEIADLLLYDIDYALDEDSTISELQSLQWGT